MVNGFLSSSLGASSRFRRTNGLHIQDVSGGIVNVLGGGSMDYSE